MALLTKSEIVTALTRLGDLALNRGVTVDLVLLGGAAMLLRFDARPSTQDVDVVVLAPKQVSIVRTLVEQVAQEHSLPMDWLNDGAKGYLKGVSEGPVVFAAPGIIVKTPSIAQLLAMKALGMA